MTILLAYAVATGSAIYGVEIARKYNDVFWLVFAIMVGLLISLLIGIIYQEFTIEELLRVGGVPGAPGCRFDPQTGRVG